ncbi:MAG: hypothetical protein Q9182_006199 [Xanthomendoza sp. 2 TL-2023]
MRVERTTIYETRQDQRIHSTQDDDQLAVCSMIILSTFCVSVGATRPSESRRKERYGKVASELPKWGSMHPDLTIFQPGELVYDRSLPVIPLQKDLYRRQDSVSIEDSSNESARTTATKPLKFASTSTASPAVATTTSVTVTSSRSSSSSSSPRPTSIVTAAETDSNLPRPFDSGLGNNYTDENCPKFINNFLRNETFISCLPFSLLLQVNRSIRFLWARELDTNRRLIQNSMSFFSVTKTLATITRTLDTTCKPVDSTCNTLMSSIALQLRQDNHCAADYRREQPLVTAAYNGLIAYEPLYKAGCARDPGNGIYCFANAITNSSSPADSYPYYLPLGIPLPERSQPSCTTCLKEMMGVFSQATGDKTQQPLLETYPNAARMINAGCGSGFANQAVGTAKSAGQGSGATTLIIASPFRLGTVVLPLLSTAAAVLL